MTVMSTRSTSLIQPRPDGNAPGSFVDGDGVALDPT